MEKNCYEILDVDQSASPDDIRKSFLYQITANHPDKFFSEELKSIAEEKSKKINESYKILSDPIRRALYDKNLRDGKNQYSTQYEADNASESTNQQHEQKQYSQTQNNHSKNYPNSGSNGRDAKIGKCARCHSVGPVKRVNFYKLQSMFVFWRMIEAKGDFCGKCSIDVFWNYSGITLLFGWIGIGLILFPFIIIINTINFLYTSDIRENIKNRGEIASGWKVFHASFVLVIIFIIFGFGNFQEWITQQEKSSIQNEGKSVNFKATEIYQATLDYYDLRKTQVNPLINNETKEPTIDNDCVYWQSINTNDKGKQKCVYGQVYDSYWGENIFYIRFSEEPNSFRFLVLNNYYYKDINGKCIMTTGEVKSFGELLYIEVEDLTDCK